LLAEITVRAVAQGTKLIKEIEGSVCGKLVHRPGTCGAGRADGSWYRTVEIPCAVQYYATRGQALVAVEGVKDRLFSRGRQFEDRAASAEVKTVSNRASPTIGSSVQITFAIPDDCCQRVSTVCGTQKIV
jgi:hypothetical protein